MADETGVSPIVRDLTLIKIGANHEGRSRVLELASVFRARVVDVAPESLAIEITVRFERKLFSVSSFVL